jgi:hypothetical protein
LSWQTNPSPKTRTAQTCGTLWAIAKRQTMRQLIIPLAYLTASLPTLLLGQTTAFQATVKIDSAFIQKLCAQPWKLIYMDEVLDGQNNHYQADNFNYNPVRSIPSFYTSGRFVDRAANKGQFSENKLKTSYHAVGQWKIDKDAILIDLNKDSTEIKDQVFWGKLTVIQFSDSSVTFHRSLRTDGTWIRTFYLNKTK